MSGIPPAFDFLLEHWSPSERVELVTWYCSFTTLMIEIIGASVTSTRIRGRNLLGIIPCNPPISRGAIIHPTSIWARCTSFCVYTGEERLAVRVLLWRKNPRPCGSGFLRLAYSSERDSTSALATISVVFTISHWGNNSKPCSSRNTHSKGRCG